MFSALFRGGGVKSRPNPKAAEYDLFLVLGPFAAGLHQKEGFTMNPCPSLCRFLFIVGIGWGLVAQAQAQDPFAPRLTTLRGAMAHGRLDSLREGGIRTGANPRGNPVRGAQAIIDAIAGMPNPKLITLGLDKTGGQPLDINKPSPIILAEGLPTPPFFKLSSGVTLVVAEVPAGGTFGGWSALGTRFGDGNLYATVSIPDKGIMAGAELVTFKQLQDYDANSIFFEAPDFGNLVVGQNLDGGSTTLTAQINGKKFSRNFGWANPLELTLLESGNFFRKKGEHFKDNIAKITVLAKLPSSFESPCMIRWAAKSSQETIIRDTPFVGAPADKSTPFRTDKIRFHIKAEKGESVSVTAVASIGPFVAPIPKQPQSVGLDTFHSRESTLGDTISVQVREPRMLKQVAGTLTKGDPFDKKPREGYHFKVFPFTLKEGQTVLIDLESYQGKYDKKLPDFFDTWLRVEDQTGKILMSNDDGGEGLNAQIEFTAPKDGTYNIIVTSFRKGGTGTFVLKIQG
jgi:hypothetical protein